MTETIENKIGTCPQIPIPMLVDLPAKYYPKRCQDCFWQEYRCPDYKAPCYTQLELELGK
jgi:hypothetical protein